MSRMRVAIEAGLRSFSEAIMARLERLAPLERLPAVLNGRNRANGTPDSTSKRYPESE